RGVPAPGRHLPHPPVVGGRGHDRRDPGCPRLPLGLSAGLPRPTPLRPHHGRPRMARAGRGRAAGRADSRPRRVPDPVPGPDQPVGQPGRDHGGDPGPYDAAGGGRAMTTLLAASGLVTPHVDYVKILPEIILSVVALLVMLVASVVRRPVPRGTWAYVTVAASAASIGASWYVWNQVAAHGPRQIINNAIALDGFSVLFLLLISVALALGALVAEDYLHREGLDGPEFYVLAMLSAVGAMFMAVANDLIVVFLGLETLSIALYVLAGYHVRRQESSEAAIKYFVLGAFSSAVFLYGVSLIYGATGSTNLVAVGSFLAGNQIAHNGVLLAGIAFLIVGLGFKVAAVPFHYWNPDVYQGSPTPVTGYMAAVAKAAGFAGLLRVLFSALHTMQSTWQPV